MSTTEQQENANSAASLETPSKPYKLSVFISGSGRTLQNLIDLSGEDFEVCSVASDRYCDGLGIARNNGIHNFQAFPTEKRDENLWNFAVETGAHYICLAGYLSLFNIPTEGKDKVLNIHPSLIPKYCGKGMYGSNVHKAVLAANETESGCTVHFCDNEYDHGPIILQKTLNIDPAWNHQDLAAAVFDLEKLAYPEAIRSL